MTTPKSVSPLMVDGILSRFKNKPTEEEPLTVCIAAICEGRHVFGACDRMLTSGDVEFKPNQSDTLPNNTKIANLSTHLVVMTAGDSSLHAAILHEVFGIVTARIKAEPENWWKVKDAAQLYLEAYSKIRLMNIRHAVLAPYGLDENSFIAKQKEMSREFVEKLTNDIANYDMPLVSAIITGLDPAGVHIYTFSNLSDPPIRCHDSVGFAAIGSGRRHAEAQFMASSHHGVSSMPETLFLTYLAKKRSEVAPGVGQATDMFGVSPGNPAFFYILPKIMNDLESAYKRRIEKEKKMGDDERKEAIEYVKSIAPKSQEKESQEAKKPDGGLPSPNGGGVSNNPPKS